MHTRGIWVSTPQRFLHIHIYQYSVISDQEANLDVYQEMGDQEDVVYMCDGVLLRHSEEYVSSFAAERCMELEIIMQSEINKHK